MTVIEEEESDSESSVEPPPLRKPKKKKSKPIDIPQEEVSVDPRLILLQQRINNMRFT